MISLVVLIQLAINGLQFLVQRHPLQPLDLSLPMPKDGLVTGCLVSNVGNTGKRW